MRKFVVLLLIGLMITGAKTLAQDKDVLENQIIRLHVVGQSDTAEDRNIKLQVKNAVVAYLNAHIPQNLDVAGVREYLSRHLHEIQNVANEAVITAGGNTITAVSLKQEEFPRRDYDTFSLPAGVYESLRVTIGSGEGKNWWCVVFPSLCVSASTEEYKNMATGAGFSNGLVAATAGEGPCEIRFFLLECLGRLENFFHFG